MQTVWTWIVVAVLVVAGLVWWRQSSQVPVLDQAALAGQTSVSTVGTTTSSVGNINVTP